LNQPKQELFIHHWDMSAGIGQKYLLTNAFHRVGATNLTNSMVPFAQASASSTTIDAEAGISTDTPADDDSDTYTGNRSDEIFPIYQHMFHICDSYNKTLHEYKYCHKSGGLHKNGEDGLCHKFIMACIIQNTLAAYKNLHKLNILPTTDAEKPLHTTSTSNSNGYQQNPSVSFGTPSHEATSSNTGSNNSARERRKNVTFQDLCLQLSDELFLYAVNLTD
jgi:hypothetical protein